MGDHSVGVALQRALVGQAGEGVRRRPQLGDREVAQVGQHRRGLYDRGPDPVPCSGVESVGVLHEHRPDHLAAYEQRLAGRALTAALAAQLAFEQRRRVRSPPRGAGRTARPGTTVARRRGARSLKRGAAA